MPNKKKNQNAKQVKEPVSIEEVEPVAEEIVAVPDESIPEEVIIEEVTSNKEIEQIIANTEMEQIKECPVCKSDNGYISKSKVRGFYIHTYSFKGEKADDDDVSSIQEKTGKRVFCARCGSCIRKHKQKSIY